MLVLNRKINESIIICDDIEIRILEINDGKIKIGIEAPRDVTVLRKEVYDMVIEENIKSLENHANVLEMLK